MAVGAAIALASVTAPAQAQITAVNGINACFSGQTAGSVAGCNSNSTSWTIPNDKFMFDRAPDILGQGGNQKAISFIGNNSNVFSLGWFRLDNGSDATTSANQTAKLTFDLYLNNSAAVGVSYNALTVNWLYQGNLDERYKFTGAGWSNAFTVGTEQFEFAVVGYDWPHPGSSSEYCSSYDAVPTAASANGNTGSYKDATSGAIGGKLCGQFRKVSSPNIQTVPEPSTYALMGAGLLGIFGFARRRNRNA
ncbi:PEP-CTERM sorting domain-containing protein [Gemmatimonas groenlandica]|uniref:PEP-CTERM sorting domain-containing protein n=2 Tax=Gemmatimonas groenlandica TaxID=2732249 RepID=A0A6M4ILK8_9BACT|nr:PEP-CTERM sorting domain-containing protein [Gemmatimonas groenlandica]